MALIKCPECGMEISDKAPSCPVCGCPMQPVTTNSSPKSNGNSVTTPQPQPAPVQNLTPPYRNPIPQPQPQQPAPKKKESAMGIIGLILSVFFCLPVFPVVGLILCIIAICDKKHSSVCGTIGLIICIISILIGILAPQYMKYVERGRQAVQAENNVSTEDEQNSQQETVDVILDAEPQKVFGIGDTVSNDTWELTLLDAKTYTEISGDTYTDTPSDNKVYMVIFLEAKNISDQDAHYNIFYNSAYADDYSVDLTTLFNDVEGYSLMGGDIACGKRSKGYYAFEIDENWETFEYIYSQAFTGEDQKLMFTIYKSEIE